MKKSYSIMEFLSLFTEDYCKEYLLKIAFPDGKVCCPFCGIQKQPYLLKRFGLFRCSEKNCRKDFSYKNLTIFNNCKLDIQKVFFIIYSNSLSAKSISSVQYAKNMGLSQKTMWGIQHKIRQTFYQEDFRLSGIIEVDEAWLSKDNNRLFTNNWGGITTRKTPILGLIERGGKVVVYTVPDRKRDTIIPLICQHVEKGSTVYTDGYAGYRQLKDLGYTHDWVEHSSREYVRNDVHTNSIEGFWSHLKRGIRNGHHQVSAKHLQLYINEAVFKYNNRDLSQMEKFDLILKQCLYKYEHQNSITNG